MNLPDLLGTALGLLLTIAVFSYLLGDNQFFRLAIYLFVGVSAGYVAVITLYQVLLPQLIYPLLVGGWSERLMRAIPLALALLLFFKLSSRYAWLGTLPVAVLVGTGAAVSIGGALLGTLFSQMGSTIGAVNLGNGMLTLVGTLSTLAYFQYSVGKGVNDRTAVQRVFNGVGLVGQIFIAVALGGLFAGVYTAALVAFVERLSALWSFISGFITF